MEMRPESSGSASFLTQAKITLITQQQSQGARHHYLDMQAECFLILTFLSAMRFRLLTVCHNK